MMSRSVTTSRPLMIMTIARIRNRMSSLKRITPRIARPMGSDTSAPTTMSERTTVISPRGIALAVVCRGAARRGAVTVPVVTMVVAVAPVAVAVAMTVPVAGDRCRQDGEEPVRLDDPALGRRPGHPVTLLADVRDLRLALDGGDREQVDHRLLAAAVGQLDVRAVAERVVRARVDADAAQDAAALVDLVLLQDARLGHQGAGRARLGAAAARHARGVVSAHVERRRDQRVEPDPLEVVA